jgi:hypothetical protein
MTFAASSSYLTAPVVASFTSSFISVAAKIGLSIPLVLKAEQKERFYSLL